MDDRPVHVLDLVAPPAPVRPRLTVNVSRKKLNSVMEREIPAYTQFAIDGLADEPDIMLMGVPLPRHMLFPNPLQLLGPYSGPCRPWQPHGDDNWLSGDAAAVILTGDMAAAIDFMMRPDIGTDTRDAAALFVWDARRRYTHHLQGLGEDATAARSHETAAATVVVPIVQACLDALR